MGGARASGFPPDQTKNAAFYDIRESVDERQVPPTRGQQPRPPNKAPKCTLSV